MLNSVLVQVLFDDPSGVGRVVGIWQVSPELDWVVQGFGIQRVRFSTHDQCFYSLLVLEDNDNTILRKYD